MQTDRFIYCFYRQHSVNFNTQIILLSDNFFTDSSEKNFFCLTNGHFNVKFIAYSASLPCGVC